MKTYKNVLICGYDIEEKYQRGIFYYFKSLVQALYEFNLDVGILTSAKNEKEEHILYLNILRKLNGEDFSYSISNKIINLFLLFLKFLKNKIKPTIKYLKNKENPYDYHLQRLRYLKYIRYFANIPNFYFLTSIHNRFFLKEPYYLKLDKNKVDLLFTTSPMNIKTNIPLVQTLHDVLPIRTVFHPPEDNSKIFFYRVKNMLEYSDKVLAVSNFSKEECLKIFPNYENKIFVTYEPIPIDEDLIRFTENEYVQNSVLMKYKLKKDNYLFYVGALEKRKNIKRLIEAFLSIYNKIKIPLVLAGKLGYGKEEFEFYLKLKKYKRKILFLNYINDIEKIVLLKNARAFLFPSIYEGFGIPPLEAMYLKTPVLTSNTSSLPEVCGKAALFVNPFSLDEIADGILEITLNSTLRQSLIKLGLENVKRFSLENYKKRLASVLDL